jgi:predicted aspartyl protease
MSYQLEFQYLIEYDNGKDGIFLDVEIKYSDQSIKINAKIDTGATYSIFERRFGEELGLQIEKGMRQRFGTATGGFYAYGFRVTLTTAEIELDSMVFFAEDDFFNRNVLGRISWLDNLIVGINDQNGRLYLSKYES